MSKFIALILSTFTVLSYAKTMTCTFDKKDPKGTKAEQLFEGFDYSLSPQLQKMTLSNLHLTADAKSYADAAAGEEWPTKDSGTLNPDFPQHPHIAKRHEGYQQYKNFKAIRANVRWARFEVMIDESGRARIPVTTNDGVWTEELFNCSDESRGGSPNAVRLDASKDLSTIVCTGKDAKNYPYFVYFGEDDGDFVKVTVKRRGRRVGGSGWVILSDESQQVATGVDHYGIGIDDLAMVIYRPLPTSKEYSKKASGWLDLKNDGDEIQLYCKHR